MSHRFKALVLDDEARRKASARVGSVFAALATPPTGDVLHAKFPNIVKVANE
jgi:hypothetical protein